MNALLSNVNENMARRRYIPKKQQQSGTHLQRAKMRDVLLLYRRIYYCSLGRRYSDCVAGFFLRVIRSRSS